MKPDAKVAARRAATPAPVNPLDAEVQRLREEVAELRRERARLLAELHPRLGEDEEGRTILWMDLRWALATPMSAEPAGNWRSDEIGGREPTMYMPYGDCFVIDEEGRRLTILDDVAAHGEELTKQREILWEATSSVVVDFGPRNGGHYE